MPAPRKCKIIRSDLDSEKTTRSEDGHLKRDRVREGVYKIEYEWLVEETDLQLLCSALSPVSFVAVFYDGTTAQYIESQMYAGDRSAELIIPNDNSDNAWWSFSCNLIEY